MSKASVVDSSPYGAYAAKGLCAAALRITRLCSPGWSGKRLAFFLRSIAVKALAGRPVDIESLGARMRLYPDNNVAEKRLLFTPQYFDPAERALLAERLAGDFVFLDVGASVGGYALFMAAHGGPRARILAVEPLPEIFERLVYNIDQNSFANVKAVSCALADRDGDIALFVHAGNSGETSVRIVSADARGAQLRVPAKTLLSLLHEEGYERLDAIKLDIEGAEDLVLDPFFRDAPPSLWPRLIIMEFALLRGGAQLEQRLCALGYCEILRTNENVAYEKV
jgi:FkbM family methyltransferase